MQFQNWLALLLKDDLFQIKKWIYIIIIGTKSLIKMVNYCCLGSFCHRVGLLGLLRIFNDDIIEVAADYQPFFGRQMIFKDWQ